MTRPCALFWLWGLALWGVAHASPDPDDFFQPFVADSFTYDNNVYRLSPDADPPPEGHKDDYINVASIGANFHKILGRQVFDLKLKGDDVHYAANDILDHQATLDSAVWKWAQGHSWSGRIGADYRKYLAGFANTLFFNKDLLTQPGYFFDAAYAINPSWSLNGGVRWTETVHSAKARQDQNNESVIVTGGLTYKTRREDSLGAEYRHTDGLFPDRPLPFEPGLPDNEYSEDAISGVVKYIHSPKTRFEGRAGFLQRRHANLPERNFSGETWRMNAFWTPTAKIQLAAAAWHELQSYQEVVSNFYVSEGVKFTPAWTPTEKLLLSAELRWETQDYQPIGVIVPGLAVRQDELFSAQVAVTYAPVRCAELSVAYQFEQRDSNRPSFPYKDDTVTGNIVLKF